MNIVINELRLHNFKSHKSLDIILHPITSIHGTNGAGKSSIGEAVTWALYGVDTLGNTLIKALSPEPTNYEYDRVEVHVLLTVEDKQVLISRMLENGNTLYYINETPKKATEFKQVVESLFDKNLFLSLFNPAYFFTQKWEEQRSQLLQYVSAPTNKEVFFQLPKPQAEKLGELLKQKKLEDLEATHKDNKNRQEKALLTAKGYTKALQDDYDQSPESDAGEAESLQTELVAINEQLKNLEVTKTTAADSQRSYNTIRSELDGVKIKADGMKQQFNRVKDTPIEEECKACKQPLDETTKENVKAHVAAELADIKANYNELVAKHKELTTELVAIEVIDFDYVDFQGLDNARRSIADRLSKLQDRAGLAAKIAVSQQKEQEIHDSYTESVFILDAIKAFKAKEADLMAEKVGGMFETLTLQLFQKNSGDGVEKPFFEVMQNGKPYRKLSTAEKIKAGLELIEVLCKQSGTVAPVFIDNVESILTYKQPVGQLIECRVADKEFTITGVEA